MYFENCKKSSVQLFYNFIVNVEQMYNNIKKNEQLKITYFSPYFPATISSSEQKMQMLLADHIFFKAFEINIDMTLHQ